MQNENENQNQSNPQTGPKGIDWQEAFRFYCTPREDGTLPSYADVSKKFDVSENTIEKRGSENAWVKTRDELGKNATEEFKKSMAEEQDVANKDHLIAWRRAKKSALNLLSLFERDLELHTHVQDTEVGGDKLPGKKKKKQPSPWRLQAILDSLRVSINGERTVLGMPTEISKATIDQVTRYAELSNEEVSEMDTMLNKVTKNDNSGLNQ